MSDTEGPTPSIEDQIDSISGRVTFLSCLRRLGEPPSLEETQLRHELRLLRSIQQLGLKESEASQRRVAAPSRRPRRSGNEARKRKNK